MGLKRRFAGDQRVKFVSEPVSAFESWMGHAPLRQMSSDPATTQLHIQNAGFTHYQKCVGNVPPGTVIVADR